MERLVYLKDGTTLEVNKKQLMSCMGISETTKYEIITNDIKAFLCIDDDKDFQIFKSLLSDKIITLDMDTCFDPKVQSLFFDCFEKWWNNWREKYIDDPVMWRENLDKFSKYNNTDCFNYLDKLKNVLSRVLNYKIVIACDDNYGIGKNGTIPWDIPGDRILFKQITDNSVVICGRKTLETLPLLKGRKVFCITNSNIEHIKSNNPYVPFPNINALESFIILNRVKEDLYVIGGKEIYELFLDKTTTIHFSLIPGDFNCDRVVTRNMLDDFICSVEDKHDNFVYRILTRQSDDFCESQYIRLCERVLQEGDHRQTRNSQVLSVFNSHLTWDLRQGFPLLTTKKMFLKGVVEELLFFLRGDTDTGILEQKKVNIWKHNTSSEFLESVNLPYQKGVMGPMYGFQWRFFNADFEVKDGKIVTTNKGIDQLGYVINEIKNNPSSRRIMMTTFNPNHSSKGVLFPCHSIINQFYVDGDFIDMFCYNRSQDLFLGCPFNIASSSLLLILIATITQKTPRFVYLTLGDVHIYKDHIDSVKKQVKNIKYKFPTLTLTKNVNDVKDIETLSFSDFILENYMHNPVIKSSMIA